MNIIGISGTAGAGKDTIADCLVARHRFTRVGFADPMKRFCQEVFAFSDAQVWGTIEHKNAPDKRYRREVDFGPTGPNECGPIYDYLTPRYALQTLGTEWGRNCYPDVWIDYALRVARRLLDDDGLTYHQTIGIYPASIRQRTGGVVFSDCRFRNEVDAVKRAGGKVIRVVRPGFDGMAAIAAHVSESGQGDMPDSLFDAVVVNDGTISDLNQRVDSLVSAWAAP